MDQFCSDHAVSLLPASVIRELANRSSQHKNWTELNSFTNSAMNGHIRNKWTNQALTVLVSLQPINTKYSLDAEIREPMNVSCNWGWLVQVSSVRVLWTSLERFLYCTFSNDTDTIVSVCVMVHWICTKLVAVKIWCHFWCHNAISYSPMVQNIW